MSKKIIVGGVLLLVLVVGMHYVTGSIAEKATLALQQKVLSDSDQFGELEIKNYQRGIFSSQADFAWKPPLALSVLSDDRIVFECEGDHGVVSYQYNCNVRDWAGYRDFVDQKLEGNDPLNIRGRVSLGEEIDTQLSLREFQFQTEAKDRVVVASGELNIRTEPNARRFKIDGVFDGAELMSDSSTASLGAITMDADLRINSHQIMIGQADLIIDSANLTGEKGSLELTALNLTTSTLENEDDFEFSYRLQIPMFKQRASSSIVDAKYQNLDMVLAVGGINMANFSKFYNNFKRIGEKTSDATRSGQAKSDSNANFLAMLPQFEDLFRQGTTLHSKLAVEIPAAEANIVGAEIKINLLNNLRFADYILMRVQPGALMAKFDAEFNASIPNSIGVSTADSSTIHNSDRAQPSTLIDSPWYVSKGDYSVSNVRIKGEDIVINGRPVTPREFIRLIF